MNKDENSPQKYEILNFGFCTKVKKVLKLI
jgi:hypothetical protein